MTREEAKEMLPIIQAWADGKTIQVKEKGRWVELCIDDFTRSPDMYRIKPEPKYRPFKTQEECWNEMLKHQPFGWIYSKNRSCYYCKNHEAESVSLMPQSEDLCLYTHILRL